MRKGGGFRDWMLSAARREDARGGLGSMEEEIELEEGEAYSGQEDDRCIDPDALSYIVSPLSWFPTCLFAFCSLLENSRKFCVLRLKYSSRVGALRKQVI